MTDDPTKIDEQPSEEKKETKKPSGSKLERFLAKTGFDKADVDIVHEAAGIFGTVQGGKYKLAKGGEIITLKGPPPPETE